jgi:hypothetical protein
VASDGRLRLTDRRLKRNFAEAKGEVDLDH